MRLLDHRESFYDRALVLTLPGGSAPAEDLSREMHACVPDVEVRTVAVDDPSNHAALLEQLTHIAGEVRRSLSRERWKIDVLLSAGSPEAQTVWVLLVQAGVLPARLLQLVPSELVDASAIREVSLKIGASRPRRSAQTQVRDNVNGVRATDITPRLAAAPEPVPAKLPDVIRNVESEAIERAIREHGGNIVKTSRALGIQRNTLKKKLRALGLYPSRERSDAPRLASSA